MGGGTQKERKIDTYFTYFTTCEVIGPADGNGGSNPVFVHGSMCTQRDMPCHNLHPNYVKITIITGTDEITSGREAQGLILNIPQKKKKEIKNLSIQVFMENWLHIEFGND